MPSSLVMNHNVAPLPASARPGAEVAAFHRRLPGYAPTPLRELPDGVGGAHRLLVKDESSRLGLPSFKILGASWATYRVLCERLGGEPAWSTPRDLAAVVADRLGPLRLVAATDGNHGRAVAHMAKLLGLAATVLVPTGTADARVAAIESEGADVIVVPGTYDDAVAESAAMAADDVLVVSDTSWPGYTDPPAWVIEGYSTIFAEVASQLAELMLSGVDVVFVPVGVGALAAAAGANLRAGREPGDGPLLVGVEPTSAACVAAAVSAGHVVEVPGPHTSMMAGLNCGLASEIALPVVTATFDAFVAVDDEVTVTAMQLLAEQGMDVGETGAAALAGLMAVGRDHRDALPIPEKASVLLLATEGVTDPANFARVVGRPPVALS